MRESILHVDMDAFFVEVERLDEPALRGVPVVVGGGGTRGVVAAASYEARRFGIHSAMPMARARRLCPRARVVPPDHRKYRAMSHRVFSIFEEFTPRVEAISVDEAFLDVSGLRRHYPDGTMVGSAIRERIRSELGLPASVGVATSKLIAKLASEGAKPDGLLRVPAGEEVGFLHPLPVRALWGVGEATYASLEALGVGTIGQLAALPRDTMRRRLGEAVGAHLWELAWGRDERRVEAQEEPRSISAEETFDRDLAGSDPAAVELLRQCERVGRRMRDSGYAARTITLKIRFSDFTTVTRSHTLETPVDLTSDIHQVARRLLARVPLEGRSIRLLGVGGSGLVRALEPRQMSLDAETALRLAEASDRIRRRFGDEAIGPARLARPPI